MAVLSNLYSEKEVKTVNGVDYSLTDSVKNLWTPNTEIDNSIVYTKCTANSLKTASIDIDTGKNINVLVKKSTTAYPQEYVFNIMYSPEYSMQNVNIGYCLTYGQNADFWNGFNPDKQTTSGTGRNTQFLRDFKINNIVFSVNIRGYNVSDLNNIFTEVPENIQISLDDLIKNPENYLISGITFSNPVIFKKTDTNTYEKTTNANVKIAVINMTDKSTGINFAEKICRHESFESNSPLTINVRSTNMDGDIGVTGGSYQTLYYDLSKYYSCDDVKDFDIDFPEIDLTQYKESKEFDLGYYELSNNPNSVIYGKKSIKIGYTASTDTARINNALVKLYRLLKGKFVVNLLAGAGVYMKDFTYNIPDNINPENFYASSNIYLGKMDKNGLTTGEFISGKDLLTYDGWNKDGTTNNPDFNPNISTGGDDYDDDPWGKIDWGGAYFGAGNFTNLWYCTATDLNNLRRWMNGLDVEHPLPEGFNPMNQVLGLMQFPIGLGGSVTEELTMRTQANVIVHSGVMLNRGFGDDLYYNLGSINIPLRMKERGVPFLDYGSTIELYVPFCGVFQLDPQTVLGADLSVEMWLSPVTGECNCIVSVGRDGNRGPVAFGSGNMSADIPVTANGYGLYAAAAKEASLKRSELMFNSIAQGGQIISTAANGVNALAAGEQIAGEAITGAFGAAGVIAGGIGTAIGLGISLAQATHNIRALDVGMQHAKNASGTSVSGSFSGTSAWHYPFQCYVKITRPRYKIPNNYAHTQGIPLIKSQSLGSCNGFTMCVGTDLSSVSATEIEKEQIAAFLTNGVIV